MSEHNYDVIMIGGGPARLFAGIACARNELRTLVLEKQTYPIDKACGEGIMPSGVNNLMKLGVAHFLEKYPYHLFKRISYVSAKGSVAEANFAEGCGWGVQRTKLSAALLECAETLLNLEIQEGASVACSLEENPDVSIKNNVFHPKPLIGADGLHSRVRKLANLEATIPKLKRWGVRQHFNVEPLSEFVEIHCGSGLAANVTPVSETSINVSLLWDAKRYKPEHGGKKLFCSMLNEFPELPGSLKKRRCSGCVGGKSSIAPENTGCGEWKNLADW